MMQLYKALATVFGIGYISKGGGTVAAAVCCVAWYFAFAGLSSPMLVAGIVLFITAIGIWCSSMVEPAWGKDSSRVVIDEVAGMGISLLFLPVTLPYILTGFILFRFFDIVKPLFIRKLEILPGGWGVMLDDVLAGIYSNILLQTAFYFRWF